MPDHGARGGPSPASPRGELGTTGGSAAKSKWINAAPDRPPIPPEMEIIMAEIEGRVKEMVLEVLAPTQHQNRMNSMEIGELKDVTKGQSLHLHELVQIPMKMLEFKELIDMFHHELGSFQREAAEMKVDTTEVRKTFQVEVEALGIKMQSRDSALRQLTFTVDKLRSHFDELDQRLEEAQNAQLTRVEELQRAIGSLQTELEVKMAAVGLQHVKVTDQIWSCETEIARVTGELRHQSEVLKGLNQAVQELNATKVKQESLDSLKELVLERSIQTSNEVSGLKAEFRTTVNKVSGHLEALLSASTANVTSFYDDMRDAHDEQSKLVEKAVSDFAKAAETFRKDMLAQSQETKNTMQRLEAVVQEVREGQFEMERKRRQDRAGMEAEIQASNHRVHGIFEAMGECLESTRTTQEALGKMVQALEVSFALGIQDEQDRLSVSLIGFKEEAPAPSPSNSTATPSQSPRKEQQSPRLQRKASVISVDHRCLSCSGQSPVVMAGFKMACLQYRPSPIAFEGTSFHRGELLQQIGQMLSFIRDRLPPWAKPSSLFLQPVASSLLASPRPLLSHRGKEAAGPRPAEPGSTVPLAPTSGGTLAKPAAPPVGSGSYGPPTRSLVMPLAEYASVVKADKARRLPSLQKSLLPG